MKKIIFIIFVISSACNKDSLSGTASAKQNGVEWSAKVQSGLNEPTDIGIFLYMSHFNEFGNKRSSSTFYKIPLEVGRYEVINSDNRSTDPIPGAYFGTVIDGDGIGDDYDVLMDDDVEDYLEITKIEGNNIFGEFQVSFVKNLNRTERDHAFPDTIVFTEGRFQVKYDE